MERKTLLQMTKDILEMMESDLVASINDTLESQMVHKELRNTYMHIMSRQEWAHLQRPKNLSRTVESTAIEAVSGTPTIAGLTFTSAAGNDSCRTSNVSHIARGWAGVKCLDSGTGVVTGSIVKLRSYTTDDYIELSSVFGLRATSYVDGVTTTQTLNGGFSNVDNTEYYFRFNAVTGACTFIVTGSGSYTSTIPFPNLRGGFYIEAEATSVTTNQQYSFLVKAADTTQGFGGYASFENSQNPTTVQIPTDIAEIKYFKYKTNDEGNRLQLSLMEYLSPEDFITYVQSRDTSLSNVFSSNVLYEDITIPFIVDQQPAYWTSFDNTNIVLDAFDYTQDVEGVSADKTQVMAVVTPSWTEADSFIPDMPPQLFPMLVYEAAEACMDLHKQDEKTTTTKRALLHRSLMKTKEVRHDGKTKKGFGRR